MALVVALFWLACGGGSPSGRPGADGPAGDQDLPGNINGRTIQELCATMCAHAHEHGCDSDWLYLCDGNANNCADILVSEPDCHTAYVKYNACLADYPDPCDFAGMDATCLPTYCSMRHLCNLPDPKCP